MIELNLPPYPYKVKQEKDKILICVRMIFPVELLSISHNVYLPDLLATIVGETRRVRFFRLF